MFSKEKIHEIIFEADTKAGKRFDIWLIVFILLSVIGVMLSSVSTIGDKYGHIILVFEWLFTVLFTIEYALRIYSVQKSSKYIFSFMGIVDLLAIIPTYLVFIYAPIGALVDIRILRLLRIFRVFKLSPYLRGAYTMQIALRSSRPKIIVFLLSVVLLVVLLGTLMYVVEGQQNGFDNIPESIYWSVVTLTTVGYGDVVPVTVFGKLIASIIMVMGYGIIAVPTGIVSADMARHSSKKLTTQACRSCSKEGHDVDAIYCKFCGEQFTE